MSETELKAWDCLCPKAEFPLPSSFLGKDTRSSSFRSLFTPAEDDLLLRGLVEAGEGHWEEVMLAYLPSKQPQLLKFRVNQLQSAGSSSSSDQGTNNNKFVTYHRLKKEADSRDSKWVSPYVL